MDAPTNRKSAAQVAASRDQSEEPEKAPSKTTIFDLDEASLDGRRQYQGKFRFTVPNMGQRVDIGVLQTQFKGEIGNVEGEGDSLSHALAYLEVTIDHEHAPQWWKDTKHGIELYDYPPLMSLYAKARAYEATFLGATAEPGADEGTDAGGPADDGGGDVGDDVQPPAQRRQVLADIGPRSDGAGSAVPSGEESAG